MTAELQTKSEMYACKYCGREFRRESTLAVHVCEQKKRFQEEKEVGVQIGLQAYLRFYTVTQGSAKLKTYTDFAKSPYYKAFVKFGRYCVDINAINVPKFLAWLLNQNKKIDEGKILYVNEYSMPKNMFSIDKNFDSKIRAQNLIYVLKNFNKHILYRTRY